MARTVESGIVIATIVVAGVAAAALVRSDGRYCHRDDHGVIRACTRHSVPDTLADAQAKQMLPTENTLTLYLVRTGATDVVRELVVEVSGQQVASTLPQTLIRVELPPGEHPVSLTYDDRTEAVRVDGRAGEVRALVLHDPAPHEGGRYRWEAVDIDTARRIAADARLIVDAQLP